MKSKRKRRRPWEKKEKGKEEGKEERKKEEERREEGEGEEGEGERRRGERRRGEKKEGKKGKRKEKQKCSIGKIFRGEKRHISDRKCSHLSQHMLTCEILLKNSSL